MLAPLLLLTFVHYSVCESRENKVIQDSKDDIEDTELIDLRIIDSKNSDRMIVLPNMKKTSGLRTDGIFESFLRRLLELLTTSFPERKLPKYCRILSHHTYDVEYKYAQRLAKHIKYMSQMYPEDIKKELVYYKQALDTKRPHRIAFLDAINTAFTLREYIIFDDYVYELQNYGTNDKLYMDEDTEKLINNVILGSILKLSARDRKDLERKLKFAIKEFLYDKERDEYLRFS
ncbi:unnamed protein product, partial [Brenthis ino]